MLDTMKRIYRGIRKIKNEVVFQARYLFANEIVDISFEEAWKRLNEIAPMPQSTAVVQHEMCEKQYDLVIIVPAYNAEKWIRECVDSIVSQETRYSFLAIIVDDGSTDSTGEIIDTYLPNEHLKVIHQENMGYSGARNVALKQLISDYIMFVDSDDYIIPGAIELLMSKAKTENADIVEGNGFKFDGSGKKGKVKSNDCVLWGAPWLKVMKAQLFSSVEFPEGYLYEDTIINALVEPMASKIVFMSNDVYAYRIHPESITQKHDQSLKRVDSLWIMFLMERERTKIGIISERPLEDLLQHIVFTYRRTQLLPEEVKELIFALECEYLAQKKVAVERESKLLNAIIERNYAKYELCCLSNR